MAQKNATLLLKPHQQKAASPSSSSKHGGKTFNSDSNMQPNSVAAAVVVGGVHLLASAAAVAHTGTDISSSIRLANNIRSNSVSCGGGGQQQLQPGGIEGNGGLMVMTKTSRSGSVAVGGSGADGGKKTLRLVNYMSPSIPIGLYETLAQYLEEKMNCNSWLLCESRWSAPPPPEQRPDPFTTNVADIGFMCGPGFFALMEGRARDYVEVLGVGAVHTHPYADGNAVYFSDVIVHTRNKHKYKEFEDLRGCRWAYNDAKSLSGCLCPLYHLKLRGEEAKFFDQVIPTQSHRNSIISVINDEADAAAVDSNVLFNYIEQHPEAKSQLEVIISWGPLPVRVLSEETDPIHTGVHSHTETAFSENPNITQIYPIVVNKRLPPAVKQRLKQAFLDVNTSDNGAWAERLKVYGVEKFVEVQESHFDNEHEMRLEASDLNILDAAASLNGLDSSKNNANTTGANERN